MLDHHYPVLHLVQLIRDEAHRFAVTFHRKRRQIRDRATELREIPGVGETHDAPIAGTLRQSAGGEASRRRGAFSGRDKIQAEAILQHFNK